MTQIEYARNVIHVMDAAFFFTDFGEDDVMSYIAEMIDKELIRRRTTGIAAEKYRNSLDGILYQVSEKTGIPVSRLKNCERKREVVDARFVYFRRAKEKTKHSLAEIGKIVHRDHTTVLHGIKEANQTREVMRLYKKCFADGTA
jgi:chromosomal replication initiation ATPase DnaA